MENKSKLSGTPETGPKPLIAEDVKLNSEIIKASRVAPHGPNNLSFSSEGLFLLAEDRAELYWSQDLLRLDPNNHISKTNKFGNLEVFGGRFFSNGQKPKIIIEAKDIRLVDRINIIEGNVRPSGFVFPKEFPTYSLGRMLSPEDLEQMLSTAEKNDKPESDYFPTGGFAKVDPSLSGKEVGLIPFSAIYGNTNGAKHEDAIIIDYTGHKLIPRVFYKLTPETKIH